MISLRPYQQEGVAAIRSAIADACRRILYVAPTGSGKTVLFSYIAQHAARLGTRVAICAHRDEIVGQISNTLADFDVPHGFIAAKRGISRPGLVTVAMIQTLARRHAPEFDLVVMDEAHHCASDTYLKVMDRQPGAVLLGVTATPCRLSGRGLKDVFDLLVQGPAYSSLIADGHLVPAKVYAPSTVELKGIRSRGGDFEREKLAELLDRSQITGNAIAHYRRYLNGAPSIAFCCTVAHAEHTAERFRAEGFRAASIDGSMTAVERKQRLDGLANGALNLLCSCDLVSEGVDVPVVEGALMLRPTKSTALYMQQVGRALRPSAGKTHAIVLDHVGNVFRHGLPDMDREWSLEEGCVRQPKPADEDEPDIRQCPQCYAAHMRAPRCPECGWVYPPVERPKPVETEEDLVLLTDEDKRLAIAAARTLKDFHRVAKACGYKPGWAWARWKGRMQSGKLAKARI